MRKDRGNSLIISALLLGLLILSSGCTLTLQRSATQPPLAAQHRDAFAEKEGSIAFRGSYIDESSENDFRIIDNPSIITEQDTTFLYTPDQHVRLGFTKYREKGSVSVDLVVGFGTEQAFPDDSRLREPTFNVRTSGLAVGFTRFWRRQDPTFRMASSITSGSYQYFERRYLQNTSFTCSRDPECEEFTIEENVLAQLNVNLNQAFTFRLSDHLYLGGNLFTNYLLGAYGSGFVVGSSTGLTVKPLDDLKVHLFMQLPNMGDFRLMEHDNPPVYGSNPRFGITLSYIAF